MTRLAVAAAVFAVVVLITPGAPGERGGAVVAATAPRSPGARVGTPSERANGRMGSWSGVVDAPSPTTPVGRSLGAPTADPPDLWQGKDVQWWARRAVQARKDANARGDTIARLKRTLAARPAVHDAIALASTVYRVPRSTLSRKAWCESRYSPAARNPSGAMGLYQFLPGTWRSTPFARFSPYDPYAAALAAAWMHLVGRGGEWSCR